MTNFTSIKLTVTESIPVSEVQYEYNGIEPPNNISGVLQLVQIFIVLICTIGIIGNGLVIWLLCFHIKRNPFTTYVLNLSVADLGFLIIECIRFNPVSPFYENALIPNIVHFIYSASQYFLTVISMDRCASVFFPIWHRCHRPKHLPAILCALIWILSFIPPAIGYMVYMSGIETYYEITDYQFTVNGFVCLPLMAISSLMLVSKVCSKLEGRKQRKLVLMILVTVLCFFVFSFPANAWHICLHLSCTQINIIPFSEHLCTCLNSSINPIIYGLIARPKNRCSMKSLSTMLQGLFSGEQLSVQPTGKVDISLE